MCQITGFEFRYVAPSDSPVSEDDTLRDGSVSRQEKSTQHHPGSSITTPLAQPTTTNMGGASTKPSYSTTEIVEEKSTQQEDCSTHHPSSQEPATNDASVTTFVHGGISLNGFETSSFFSCFDDPLTSEGLFDQDDTDRFPQDTCVYTVHDPSFKPSWSWVPYSHRKNTTYLRCLGVFICPMDGCKHISNATLPNCDRKKTSIPKPRGSGICFIHKAQLTHVPCDVECTLIRSSSSTEINQKGSHCHPRPHELKASKKACQRLQDIVNVNSEAKPLQVMMGTPTRESARSIHPSLGHLGRLSYLMKKLKYSSRSIDIDGILSMQKEMGMDFILVCDLIQGVIVIQFPAMKMIVQNNKFYAFQTDTIEGWISQASTDTFKWNAHVTSVHCDTISRHVPVLVSLTRSRTTNDYKIHFDHLFKSMGCQTFEQFLERFPGNISDFSASEQAGFKASLIDLATSFGHVTIDVDKLMQQTYRFCEVREYFSGLFSKFNMSGNLVGSLDGPIDISRPVLELRRFFY
jgi:hypothetical protein